MPESVLAARVAPSAARAERAAAPKPGRLLIIGGVLAAGLTTYLLVGLDGWRYYTAPLGERAYTPAHQLLRPAGRVGHLLGVAGFLMMLMPLAYAARKKLKPLRSFGTMKTWLDLHILCGVIGPVCVTFHTSFKFNGIISVAYWSMVAVVLSGFAGRYLYTRIPHSMRGIELDRAELDRRAADLGRELADAAVPDLLLRAIGDFEQRVVPDMDRVTYPMLLTADSQLRRETARFRARVANIEGGTHLHDHVVAVATERATLLRRLAYLQKTKRLFDLWHVFHMPLVYIMFAIVSAHIAITLYMGYVPFVD